MKLYQLLSKLENYPASLEVSVAPSNAELPIQITDIEQDGEDIYILTSSVELESDEN